MKHDINTGDHVSIEQFPRRIPPQHEGDHTSRTGRADSEW